MKGVILAAGYGGRLRPLTLDTPKVLLEIGGRPLIHYSVDALSATGISEIAVVVGHQAQKIRDVLSETHPELTLIYNERYHGDNALSVYAARSFVMGEPFMVCMGDHPVSPEILQSLSYDRRDGSVLCVDRGPWHTSQTNDATRVLVDSRGYIASIGKQLGAWNAIDTGVFKMTEEVFPAVEGLMESRGTRVGITDMVTAMGEGGRPFATCDVTGMFWADVDTLQDYHSVESLVREEYGERV